MSRLPPVDLARYAAVVFDMDGVLLDSEPIHFAVTARLLAREGHVLEEELYRIYVGTTLAATWADLHRRLGLRHRLADYERWYEHEVLAALSDPLAPAPGARALVAALRDRGVPLALASSSQRTWIVASLRGIGLDGAFPVVVSGQDVARGKPAPDIYAEAARRLGVPAARCLAIEDAPHGVASARAASMDVVAVRTPLNRDDPFLDATAVVASLEEMVPVGLEADRPSAIEVVVRRAGELTGAEREEYARMRSSIDYGEVLGYRFASEREWRVLVRVDGRLASHAGVGRRRVAVDGQEMEVGAVGGVWTAPELRGRGLARLAMTAATRLLCGEAELRAGLLICREPVAAFYQRLGWTRIAGPVVFDQPTGRVVWDRPALAWRCGGRPWPDGVIDLRGLPW